MKKYIAIMSILTLAACSNHQNGIAAVDSDGERMTCKQAQKNTRSPFEVKECTKTAQLETRKDREKEELADRKLQETRRIGYIIDKN